MEAITQSLIDGKFKYDAGSLDISSRKIELSIQKGAEVRGSFHICSVNGTDVKGEVLSSGMRMTCLTPSFEGVQTEILFSFSGAGMEEGDIHKGEFFIISDAGEYTIPYVVTVEHGIMDSTLGPIKNLFHFANLAKSNWSEAVSLFYHPAFMQVFHGNDTRYIGAYRGLSKNRGNEQNVDEFLVQINKKQRIEYLAMEERIRMEEPIGVAEGRITITRNGWGYTALAIETDGDFLFVEKKLLTDDDFLGNICNFGFQVDSAKLHAGNNYGYVRLYNHHFSMKIEIMVTKPLADTPLRSMRKEMKSLVLELMESYCAFRMKKIPSDQWLKESGKIVARMNVIDEKSIPARLFHAQLLITEERSNEAKWILDRVSSEMTYASRKPEHWCYYLYLTSLINRNEIYAEEVAREVEQIFAQNPDSWQIAWLLLYLRQEFSKSPYKKWAFLEEQFYGGCTSPVLYVEAVAVLSANPTMLMKLSEFEMQILNYAAKKELLKKDLIMQIQAIAAKYKGYSKRLLFILEMCYEVEADDETLRLICSLLMKGNKTEEKYFKWYARGVERELRVTKLFEFYMMSLPEQYERELPKMIMMYFAYHSDLEYGKKTILYNNILKYKERYPEIALNYREPMERFVTEQIEKGHIDKNLAQLYKELIQPAMLREELAQQMIPIIFSNLITVQDDNITQVILIYDKLKGETIYPVVDRKAIVPIYGSSYHLLLQDERGNRKMAGEPYTIEKLMIPGRFVKELTVNVQTHLGLDLYMCENAHGGIVITEKNEACYQRLWDSDRITEDFRKEIRLRLARYYYETDHIRETDALLAQVQPEDMGVKERAEFIEIMIARTMYEKAYEWLCMYGEEQTDVSAVVRLLSRLIVRNDFKPDAHMLKLAFEVFRRKQYDENILRYLVAYYEGSTKDMRDVWKAAGEWKLDTNQLCERILVQTLKTGFYVGERNDMFYSYVKHGAKRKVEIAYLIHEAYDYFVKGQVIDDKMFAYFTKLFYRGEELHDVCRLAYLKYYAGMVRSCSEEVLHLVRRFLEYFRIKGIYFPFFKEYAVVLPEAETLLNKTMIEYHAAPDSRVMLHYVIEKGEENSSYMTEPMQNMFEGVFVRSFVLFFGETLQYYITEENSGEEQLTESGTISKNDTEGSEGENRYSLLNALAVAKTLEDYPTYHKLYEEYECKKFMTQKLFPL